MVLLRSTESEEIENRGSSHFESTESSWSSAGASAFDLTGDGMPANTPDRRGFDKHYEIIRQLGRGGMGSVFLARDRRLGRLVAVKMLHHEGQSPGRLLEEARATAQATHENIVNIYGIGMFDGRPYMILEYLAGQTVREALAKSKNGAGRAIPRALALDITMAVARALAAAHGQGVIHRDLKPENIMLLDSGLVKLLDFGLARRSNVEERKAARGTLAYMSPEQWRGQDVDARTDIWALGLVLFEMLAGVHPLLNREGLTFASIADVETPMPSLRELGQDWAGLSDVVDRCLRKRKEERYVSMAALLDALEPFCGHSRVALLGGRESPYTGLAAFQEVDADLFFGREQEVTAVSSLLRRQALVTIAGASGVGKSSFVRAGIIPALKRSGELWEAVVIRPGRSPLSALRDACLADRIVDGDDWHSEPGFVGAHLRSRCAAGGPLHRTVIFIDQFEELFTLGASSSERAAYLACLMGIADDETSPLRVILTIRADFLERLAEDRVFLERVRTGLLFLPPMDRSGLRDALLRPLEATEYRFEGDSMVEEIIDELSTTKCPLPLLQFTALVLWNNRDHHKKLLSRAVYDSHGGVAGALSAHADDVVSSLSEHEQRLCRSILLRLVTPERTRAVVPLLEITELGGAGSAVLAVVHTLCAARLLMLDTGEEQTSTNVELVHESLIERWPILIRWLDENAGDAHFLSRLRVVAAQWARDGNPSGLLWRDEAAGEARAFYERYRTTPKLEREIINATEEHYLRAVIAWNDAWRKRRRNVLVGGFAFMTVTALVVFALAVDARAQARRADEEAARVRERNTALALEALKGRNATRILAARKMADDPTAVLAILREVEAPDIPRDWPELVSLSLIHGVARREGVLNKDRPPYSCQFNPDGKRIACAFDDRIVRILDADSLTELARFEAHSDYVWSIAWSPDGKRFVTASGDKTARVQSVDSPGVSVVLRGHSKALESAHFSSDGQSVVTSSVDQTVRVFNANDGREVLVLPHDSQVHDAAFSPDGRHIATGANDGVVRVWNGDGSGKPLELRGHRDEVVALAYRNDGERLATVSKDKTVRIWDMVHGAEPVVLRGHEDKIMSVAWSSDGERIATASKDMTARIWSANGFGDPIVLRGHKHWVYSAAISPDNRRIVTASLDRSVRLWNLDDVVHPLVLRGHTEITRCITLSPDGRYIATGSDDNTLRIWSTERPEAPLVLPGTWERNKELVWSYDGNRLAQSSERHTAMVWSRDAPNEVITLRGHTGSITGIGWNASGNRLVTTAADGTARLWTRDGHELSRKELFAPELHIEPHVFGTSLHSRVGITGVQQNVGYLWNLDKPEEFDTLEHESPIEEMVWLPDGSQVLTITKNGFVRRWARKNLVTPIPGRIEAPFRQVAMANDRRIGAVYADGTIRVYSEDAQRVEATLGQPGRLAKDISFSPDGRRMLAEHEDPLVHVLNSDGSGIPFVLQGSAAQLGLARWSRDGKRIAVESEEYVARIWPAVQPFSGVDDERLWKPTSLCLSVDLRRELFGVTELVAIQQMETCRRRTAAYFPQNRP